jgi:transposase
MSGHSRDERTAPVILDVRRRRTPAEKEAILAELKMAGATVSAVARRHQISPSLVFRWRREFSTAGGKTRSGSTAFVPVVLGSLDTARGGKSAPVPGSGIIEIELQGGRLVRVDGSVDVSTLRRVIDVLELR